MSQFQTASQRWKNHKQNGATSHPPPAEEPATVKAAQALARTATGYELDTPVKNKAGQVLHYGFGAASGMFYGALAEYQGKARAGWGTTFGTGLWAAEDEFAVPVLRLSQPPRLEDLSAHGYGLASHLVYGITADAVSRGVRALL